VNNSRGNTNVVTELICVCTSFTLHIHRVQTSTKRGYCIVCCHPSSDSSVTSPVHSGPRGPLCQSYSEKPWRRMQTAPFSPRTNAHGQPETFDGSLPWVALFRCPPQSPVTKSSHTCSKQHIKHFEMSATDPVEVSTTKLKALNEDFIGLIPLFRWFCDSMRVKLMSEITRVDVLWMHVCWTCSQTPKRY